MKTKPSEPMMRGVDVAKWLGVHVNTVKRMGERGELRFYRIGPRGDRRYSRSDVEAYLSERSNDGGGRTLGDARGANEGIGNGELQG